MDEHTYAFCTPLCCSSWGHQTAKRTNSPAWNKPTDTTTGMWIIPGTILSEVDRMPVEAQKSQRWSDKPQAEVRQLNTSARTRCPHARARMGVWPQAQILLIGIMVAGPKDRTSLGCLHVALAAVKLQTWLWPRPQADLRKSIRATHEQKMRGGRIFFIMHFKKKVEMSRKKLKYNVEEKKSKYNVENKVNLLRL